MNDGSTMPTPFNVGSSVETPVNSNIQQQQNKLSQFHSKLNIVSKPGLIKDRHKFSISSIIASSYPENEISMAMAQYDQSMISEETTPTKNLPADVEDSINEKANTNLEDLDEQSDENNVMSP